MYCIIINPSAGRGRAEKAAEPIKKVLDEEQVEYKLFYTQRPHHATELARQAVEDGYERVIAVGGDGTFREVAQALVHTGCPMGVIPAGTGNDFSKTLGIPEDILEATRMALSDRIHTIDVINTKQNVCINISCIGLDADTVYYANKFKRFLRGFAAYMAGLIHAIIKYKPMELSISIDGGEWEHTRQAMFIIANGIYYGGGFKPVPMADLQSGHISLMYTGPLKRWQIMNILPKFIKGDHVNSSYCSFSECKEVRIKAESECMLNIDGEINPLEEESFSIVPAALKVVAQLYGV